jgi:hypothetical protein
MEKDKMAREWEKLSNSEMKKADSRWVFEDHPLLALKKPLKAAIAGEQARERTIAAANLIEQKFEDFLGNMRNPDEIIGRNPYRNELTESLRLCFEFVEKALKEKLLDKEEDLNWATEIIRFDYFVQLLQENEKLNFTKTAFKALVRNHGKLKAQFKAYFGEQTWLQALTSVQIPKTISNSKIVVEKVLAESKSMALQFPSVTEEDSNSFKLSEPRLDFPESSKYASGYENISNSPKVRDLSMVGEVASNMRIKSMPESEKPLESPQIASKSFVQTNCLFIDMEGSEDAEEEEEDDDQGDFFDSFTDDDSGDY